MTVSASTTDRAVPIFRLDFDNDFEALCGSETCQPANANLPQLGQGLKGAAPHFDAATGLTYKNSGAVNSDRGTLSMWVCLPQDHLLSSDKQLFVQLQGETPFSIYIQHYKGMSFAIHAKNRMIISHFHPSRFWKADEWHHLAVSWDNGTRIQTWCDGIPSGVNHNAGDREKMFLPNAWEAHNFDQLSFGSPQADAKKEWTGALDDIRFFADPLSDAEMRREFASYVPISFKLLDPYFFAGKEQEFRLIIEDFSGAENSVAVDYRFEDTSGASAATGKLDTFTLAADGRKRFAFPVTLPAPGDYQFTCEFGGVVGAVPRSFEIKALPQSDTCSGSANRKEVVTIDVTQENVLVESAPSRVVESPIGSYREAGQARNDRFAVKFTVKEPHTPHVATFTYPDNAVRTIEILYQPLETTTRFQGQGGVFTGAEYALSGAMREYTITFWPRCRENAFIFMTLVEDQPAAVQSIKIEQLTNGFAPLPVREFFGSVSTRLMGLWHEDPVMGLCWGSAEPDNPFNFPGFEHITDRMLDYLQSMGLNCLNYPVAWYRGPLYGLSDVEPMASHQRYHPYMFPQYLMKRLSARGMKFIGSLHMQQLASLIPYTILDEQRVIDGEETVVNMQFNGHLFFTGWHGADQNYNPIDPRVMDSIKAVVAEITDLFGKEESFTGIMINAQVINNFTFGSLESGYNDCNINRFEQETGTKIPVEPTDPQRVTKRYDWLMANAREEWIAWRCRAIHDYFMELAAILRKDRKDLTFWIEYRIDTTAVGYFDVEDSILASQREQGIDIHMFADDEGVAFMPSSNPNNYRYRQRRYGKKFGQEDFRCAALAPELYAPAAKDHECGVIIHDTYFESPIGSKEPLPLPSPAVECPWRVSALSPPDYHVMESFAHAMNATDPIVVTKGGFLSPFNGIEKQIAFFARAYACLPAVRFDNIENIEDPVRGRQKTVDGAAFFYLQNRIPAQVTVELDTDAKHTWTNLSTGKTLDTKTVVLQPYELISFRADTESARINGAATRVAREFVDAIEAKIEKVKQTHDRLMSEGGDMAGINPFFVFAETLLDQKQYGRLHLLMQESWVPQMTYYLDGIARQRDLTQELCATGRVNINCACEQEYVDPEGTRWFADQPSVGPTIYGHEDAVFVDRGAIVVEGSVAQRVYQTETYGKRVTYRVPLPNGAYNVELHFSESWFKEPGKRAITVKIAGKTFLEDFDIIQHAGGLGRAATKTCFGVEIHNEPLLIVLTGNVAINGISVIKQ